MPRRGGHRHLVYFIDGTWLWAGSNQSAGVYSNIYRMNMHLRADGKDDHAQITHYTRGLGAVNGLNKYTSGGFSYGIDDQIADLYVNICSNYEEGDKIYLFGFSRGAVVARALSGLLSMGILDADHINMFGYIWDAYVTSGQARLRNNRSNTAGILPNLRGKYSNETPEIEFLGVFDTVSGGAGVIASAQKLRIPNGNLSANVKNAVQLLAIDESRDHFRPITWSGRFQANNSAQKSAGHLEQIWMPGVHSDIGGAYHDRFLGDLSLFTMIDRVTAKTDLAFDEDIRSKIYEQIVSPSGGHIVRVNNEISGFSNYLPFYKSRRNLDPNISQFIHQFAFDLRGKPVFYKHPTKTSLYNVHRKFEILPVAPISISEMYK